MKVTGYGRGRSSATFSMELVDGDGTFTPGTQFEMMLSDITKMMMNGDMAKGVINGRWTFGKMGTNYGMRWLADDE
jgi:hypothetical protein